MTFCDKEKQLIDGGVTCIDNRFIINYLPDAPDVRSAVYLLGLTLSQSSGSDNSVDTLAGKLGITPGDVISAFQYWEELGLVTIVGDNPPKVIYLADRDDGSALKKIKPGKYNKFSKAIQSVIEGRMITVNEYNEYYNFLESTTFEPDALVAVAKYCAELKGGDINYRYILTVARNLLSRGQTTLAVVAEALDSQQKYDDDLKIVFKSLGISRKFDHTDRQMYEKWTRELGFTADVINQVAKNCKGGGMPKLDGMLTEYYKKGALSVKEMQAYDEQKTRLYDLARAVNKTIGVYYQSLDPVVDEYIVDWVRKGYDEQTILAVGKYCFRSGIRTLSGLAGVIDKLYRNGVTTVAALEQYLAQIAEEDDKIKQVLARAGLDRRVTNSDRKLYKNWTDNWNMPEEIIAFVAQRAAGTANPIAYVNRVLGSYNRDGVTTLEQAKKQAEAYGKQTAATTAETKKNIGGVAIEEQTYTDEELRSLFTALDDTEE